MNELFETEGQSIFTFKAGDIIYRTKPTIKKEQNFNELLGVMIETVKACDNGFRRSPVEFVAIENNVIYLRSLKKDYQGKQYIYKCLLDEYADDWALFKIPTGLTLEDCL